MLWGVCVHRRRILRNHIDEGVVPVQYPARNLSDLWGDSSREEEGLTNWCLGEEVGDSVDVGAETHIKKGICLI